MFMYKIHCQIRNDRFLNMIRLQILTKAFVVKDGYIGEVVKVDDIRNDPQHRGARRLDGHIVLVLVIHGQDERLVNHGQEDQAVGPSQGAQ